MSNGTRSIALAILAAFAALGEPSPAWSGEPWSGVRVMARASGTKLKIGPKVTAALNAGSVFPVDQERGPWLWVNSGNIRGWVKKSDVVAFDQAIAYFNGVIAADPSDAHAYVCRGIARHARKDYGPAVDDFTQAARLDPSDPWPYHDRAAARYARQEYALALEDADQAVKLSPACAAHLANRACVRFALKQYEGAIADYTAALGLLKGDEASLDDTGAEGSPGEPLGRLCAARWTCARAECHAALHALDRAARDYAEALRVDPGDAATINSLAWLLATCDDSQTRNGLRAFSLAARACALTGYRNHLFLDTLAAAYAEAGDYVAAVRWQAVAIDLASADPRFAEGYRARMKLFQEKTPYREHVAQ